MVVELRPIWVKPLNELCTKNYWQILGLGRQRERNMSLSKSPLKIDIKAMGMCQICPLLSHRDSSQGNLPDKGGLPGCPCNYFSK